MPDPDLAAFSKDDARTVLDLGWLATERGGLLFAERLALALAEAGVTVAVPTLAPLINAALAAVGKELASPAK